MSNQTQARRTTAEVAFGNPDLTKSIQKFLLSLSYTDNEKDKADSLTIKLQDWGLGLDVEMARRSGTGCHRDRTGKKRHSLYRSSSQRFKCPGRTQHKRGKTGSKNPAIPNVRASITIAKATGANV